MSAVQKIREFIASDDYRSMVSLGYEIETQFDGSDDREFDSDSFWDNLELTNESILDYVGLSYNREWIRYIDNNVSGGLLSALGVDEDSLRDHLYELEYENEDSDYWCGGEKKSFAISGFNTCSDGSVSGWEFKTFDQLDEGGIDYTTATQLGEVFFDELESGYTCDVECSCHVHLKVKGVRYHQGSYKLYMLIIDELSKVWSSDTIPETLLTRIKRCSHYYSPKSNHTDKYNVVRVHPQGTWEFRLWGNVQEPSDVKFAIDSTIDCFRKAYSRYYQRDEKLFTTVQNLNPYQKVELTFQGIASDAMREGSSIEGVIASRLINS